MCDINDFSIGVVLGQIKDKKIMLFIMEVEL
jgi:hypothetical protein